MIAKLLIGLFVSCALFSENITFFVEEESPEICQQIDNGLEEFNIQFFTRKYGSSGYLYNPFVIYGKDDDGKVIAGLYGYICTGMEVRSWAHVDFAWVDKDSRLQGIGTQLFERVEVLAKEKHCDRIQLYTWEYQAVGFYEKLGYLCIGRIPQWIDGYDAVFFAKDLKE